MGKESQWTNIDLIILSSYLSRNKNNHKKTEKHHGKLVDIWWKGKVYGRNLWQNKWKRIGEQSDKSQVNGSQGIAVFWQKIVLHSKELKTDGSPFQMHS